MALQDSGILKKFFYDTLNAPPYIPQPKYKEGEPIGNGNTNNMQKVMFHLSVSGVCLKAIFN